MHKTKTYRSLGVIEKISDFGVLIKFKLSLTVVFSSIMSFLILGGASITAMGVLILFLAGMLVTGAANAINQVLEKDFDVLMERTKNRPVASGRMNASEAILYAGLMCLLGVTLLGFFNPLSAFLGMLSLVLYAFLYTPLKRFSTVAVLIGTIPGALPILIGGTAAEGHISEVAIILFLIQVLWQLPHFWAIGFLAFDDYNKAGYKLLPSDGNEVDRNVGLYAMISAVPLIALAIAPAIYFGYSWIACLIVAILSIAYIGFAYGFYKKHDRPSALKLMFSSFAYLPLVLLTYYLSVIF